MKGTITGTVDGITSAGLQQLPKAGRYWITVNNSSSREEARWGWVQRDSTS